MDYQIQGFQYHVIDSVLVQLKQRCCLRTLIVIPAYNEASNIPIVVRDLRSNLSGVDIVIVNDGSTDDTEKEAINAGVNVLTLPFNVGIGSAVQTGFRYAVEKGYDIAVQFDGDGQHMASEAQSIIQPVAENKVDVAIGSRFLRAESYKIPLVRKIGIRYFSILNSLIVKQKVTDNTSGFRAYNQRTICFLAEHYPQDYPEPEAIVILRKHGFKLMEVPVQMQKRQHGSSSIGMIRSIYYMIKVTLAILIDLLKKKEEVVV